MVNLGLALLACKRPLGEPWGLLGSSRKELKVDEQRPQEEYTFSLASHLLWAFSPSFAFLCLQNKGRQAQQPAA